ncbi:hypothetical protein [Oceanimonas smirnovii]|uniref:hypothetical protein n=1 Tax=Oceanimonas smirnovii TaxID=264574 RepID=UPI003FCF4BA6
MSDDSEFNLAALNAWYATRLERDKHLFSVSSLGLGILVTLATSIGFSDFPSLVVFALAAICFLLCISSVLWIFHENSNYLMKVVNGSDERSKLLSALDNIAVSSFLLGMIFSVLLGLFSLVSKLEVQL